MNERSVVEDSGWFTTGSTPILALKEAHGWSAAGLSSSPDQSESQFTPWPTTEDRYGLVPSSSYPKTMMLAVEADVDISMTRGISAGDICQCSGRMSRR